MPRDIQGEMTNRGVGRISVLVPNRIGLKGIKHLQSELAYEGVLTLRIFNDHCHEDSRCVFAADTS